MPLYEYECEACSHRFEKIQKFSDPPADTCPKCGGKVTKLFSSPAIQFKGSGWYITDYAKKSGSVESSKSSGDKKSDKGESSSDSSSAKTSSESSSSSSTTSASGTSSSKSD